MTNKAFLSIKCTYACFTLSLWNVLYSNKKKNCNNEDLNFCKIHTQWYKCIWILVTWNLSFYLGIICMNILGFNCETILHVNLLIWHNKVQVWLQITVNLYLMQVIIHAFLQKTLYCMFSGFFLTEYVIINCDIYIC